MLYPAFGVESQMDLMDHITYKCPKCHENPIETIKITEKIFRIKICDFCKGNQNLDFIENVFGVTYTYEFWYPPLGEFKDVLPMSKV